MNDLGLVKIHKIKEDIFDWVDKDIEEGKKLEANLSEF